MIFVDTNVLLRSLHPGHPHFLFAEAALSMLRLRNETLCLAPQNLVEFWAVATRPRHENGLGMTTARAGNELSAFRRFFRLLPYLPEVMDTWRQIVTAEGVSGKQTHDAHLVALMRVHSVVSILTFNVSHFERFPGIGILNPVLLASPTASDN